MKEFRTHQEQVDTATLEKYHQAAGMVGNIAVSPLKQEGEAFTTSKGHQSTVAEGHTLVTVSGVTGPEGMGPFHQQVAELQTQQAPPQPIEAPKQ